jgi:hypothetical protein
LHEVLTDLGQTRVHLNHSHSDFIHSNLTPCDVMREA